MEDRNTDRSRRRQLEARGLLCGWSREAARLYAWAWTPVLDEVPWSSELKERVRDVYGSLPSVPDQSSSMAEYEDFSTRLLSRCVDIARDSGEKVYAATWSEVLAGRDPDAAPENDAVAPALKRLSHDGRYLGRIGLF